MFTKSSKRTVNWKKRAMNWSDLLKRRNRNRKTHMTNHNYPEIYSAYYFNFLDEELDKICEAIGATRDSVKIIQGDSNQFDCTILKAVPQLVDGIKEPFTSVTRMGYKNLPFIHYNGAGNSRYKQYDWGYHINTVRIDGELIKYAEVGIESGEIDNLKTFLVIPTGKVWKLLRYGIKNYSSLLKSTPLPIIEQDKLNLILDNTLRFLQKKRIVKEYGFKAKRGILLTGPPGNGKTMLCRYIKAQCGMKNISYHSINSTDLTRLISDGELDNVLANHTVVFFDDIDISMLNRASGGKVVCSLLGAMSGMNDNETSIKIFTTNENTKSIDPAFLRPGRIDLFVEIDRPNSKLRAEYLNKFWPKELLATLSVDDIVDKTHGLSFAEIEYIGEICVNHKIFTGDWNIQKALEEFKKTRDLDERKVGF